jgi:SPP1 gp7 family putative phage head morphogenesis protein
MNFGIPDALSGVSHKTASLRRRPVKRSKKVPIQLFPANAQKRYAYELNAFVSAMTALTKEHIYPQIEPILSQAEHTRASYIKTDDVSDEIQAVVETTGQALSETFPHARLHQAVLSVGLLVSRHNRKEVIKVLSFVSGVQVRELFPAEPFLESELSAFVKHNIRLIQTVPSRYFSEIEGVLYRGAQQGLSHTSVKKQIAERFGVSRNRAKVIARDQVGKLNSQLTQLRHQALGIKKYRWRTVGDERVRGNPSGLSPKATPSHWSREGKVFSWASPPQDGHPGQPIQCRCVPEPILP